MWRPRRRPRVRYSLDEAGGAPPARAQPRVSRKNATDRSQSSPADSASWTSGRSSLKKAWSAPGVEVELDVLAERLQLGLELAGGLRREVVVLPGGVAQHGAHPACE